MKNTRNATTAELLKIILDDADKEKYIDAMYRVSKFQLLSSATSMILEAEK